MIQLTTFARVSTIASLALLGALQASVASAAVDAQFMSQVANAHPEIPAEALKIAYQFLIKHEDVFTNQDYMTIIDFGLGSDKKRMFVIDTRSGEVSRYYVAHGSGSGSGKYATQFSNVSGSNETALGVYRTFRASEVSYNGLTGIFSGEHGRSLKIKGLQSTNSNSERRDIIIHEADYVRESVIREQGYAGHSSGCFALDPQVKNEVINKLVGGSLILAYHKGMMGNSL